MSNELAHVEATVNEIKKEVKEIGKIVAEYARMDQKIVTLHSMAEASQATTTQLWTELAELKESVHKDALAVAEARGSNKATNQMTLKMIAGVVAIITAILGGDFFIG